MHSTKGYRSELTAFLEAALRPVESIGGWDLYGEKMPQTSLEGARS